MKNKQQVIEEFTRYITDDHDNEWRVIDVSDLDDLIDQLYQSNKLSAEEWWENNERELSQESITTMEYGRVRNIDWPKLFKLMDDFATYKNQQP